MAANNYTGEIKLLSDIIPIIGIIPISIEFSESCLGKDSTQRS